MDRLQWFKSKQFPEKLFQVVHFMNSSGCCRLNWLKMPWEPEHLQKSHLSIYVKRRKKNTHQELFVSQVYIRAQTQKRNKKLIGHLLKPRAY